MDGDARYVLASSLDLARMQTATDLDAELTGRARAAFLLSSRAPTGHPEPEPTLSRSPTNRHTERWALGRVSRARALAPVARLVLGHAKAPLKGPRAIAGRYPWRSARLGWEDGTHPKRGQHHEPAQGLKPEGSTTLTFCVQVR